jgi:hypothetical protein
MKIYKHFTNKFAAVQHPSGNYILKTSMLDTGIAEVPASMIESSLDWQEENIKETKVSEEDTINLIHKMFEPKSYKL